MYDLSGLQQLLRAAGWPDVVVNTRDGALPLIPLMAAIGMAESSGNPDAHNPKGENSWGLWQINLNAHPYSVAQVRDPLTNAQLALAIYNQQGLGAWGAGPNHDRRYQRYYAASLAAYQGAAAGNDEWANVTAGLTDLSSSGNYDEASATYLDASIFPQVSTVAIVGAGVVGLLFLIWWIDG